MDKIDSLGQASSYKSLKKKKTKKGKESGITKFSELVESIKVSNSFLNLEENNLEIKEVEDFLNEIYEIGNDLKLLPSIGNIKRYKQAVKCLLKYIVKHMLGTEEKISGANILKRKKYRLIKIVDKKLEKFALDFIKSQGQEIDILSRVDEINGLIIDILK